ncbi:hypothetical protein JCM21900_004069 [Sporobolomyces salmonicolor]
MNCKVVDQLQAFVYERHGRYRHPEAPPTPPKYLDPSSPTVSEPGYAPDSSPPSQPLHGRRPRDFNPPPPLLTRCTHTNVPARGSSTTAVSPPSSGYNLFRHQPHHHQRASFPSSSTSYPSPHYHSAPPLPATSTSSYSWPSPAQARSSTWPVQHPSSDFTAPSAPYHDLPPEARLMAWHSRQFIPAERNYPTHKRELLSVIDCLKTWHIELLGGAFTVLSDHKKLEDKFKEAYAKDEFCKMAKENVESIPGWQLDPGSRFLYFEG